MRRLMINLLGALTEDNNLSLNIFPPNTQYEMTAKLDYNRAVTSMLEGLQHHWSLMFEETC